ncbi:MAG: hypothetical protein R3F43_00315 [bacterium]
MRVWILGVFCLCGVAQAQSPRAPLGPWPGPGFQRGVVYSSWDGSYPAEQAWRGHLARFKELGIDALEVLTFAHQPAVDGPEIRADRADFPVAFITAARAAGFRILLKPHVWSRQFYDGSGRWRGSIQMPDAERWAAWFQAYEAFIVAQARQAAALGVEIFSVGLEYVEATRGHDAEWRRVIAAVRAVYPGLLTYSADYNHEIGHIAFWDALDVIGVNGYMKLADEDSPGAVALAIGISPHFVRIGALATRFGKPVLFTEVGFPSVTTAARLPWQWPQGSETVDLDLQARAYGAVLGACSSVPWCAGLYWWKYYELPERTSHAHDYTPAGKPAEQELARWYRQRAPGEPPAPTYPASSPPPLAPPSPPN